MKKIMILAFVFILALSMTACAGQESDDNEVKANEAIAGNAANANAADESTLTVQDENIRYSSGIVEKLESYNTLQELNNNAEHILIGKCISTETIFQNETIYTLSQVQVDKVYKGGIVESSIIQIVENGGAASQDVLAKESGFHEKTFFDSESVSSDITVVVGSNGYFPLEKDQEVMLFLNDSSGFLKEVSGTVYSIAGIYDGKLLKDTQTSYSRPTPESEPFLSEHVALTIDLSDLEALG